jgi:hypothetical protein
VPGRFRFGFCQATLWMALNWQYERLGRKLAKLVKKKILLIERPDASNR